MALSPGKHGVIVTHGIGDNMKPGNLLADFTNSLADALMESPKKGKQEIRREADLSQDPPSVTLQIKSPSEERATWVCKEAFWGDAFPPPKASTVVWWLLTKNISNQIQYVWEGFYKDPANDERFIPEKDKRLEKKRHPGARPWRAKTKQKSSYIILSLKSASTVWIIPLAGIIYLFLFLIWICQFIPIIPSIGPLENVLKWVRKLDPFLSNSLGDVQRYIEHGVWSANARAQLEKVIIAMLNDRFGRVKDITIVAHSMGCVVTYDALAKGGKVADEVKRLKSDKKITFVSVGSGINQVFPLAKKSNLYAQEQFKRPLAKEITGYNGARKQTAKSLGNKFFWLDIYARRDPVPAGDLDDDIIVQAEVDPEWQVKRRKVINTDNIMFDHTSYWANKDTVMPRIARAINSGTEYPWPEAGITPEKLSHRAKYATRLGRLAKLVIGVVIAAGCVALGLKLAGIW